jgi:peptidoglycan lytic transglycosylase D
LRKIYSHRRTLHGYLGHCLFALLTLAALSACYSLNEGAEKETRDATGASTIKLGDPQTDLSHLDDTISVLFADETQPAVAGVDFLNSSSADDDIGSNAGGTHSIWPRVRSDFRIKSDIDHDSLQTELNWYRSHPDYLDRVLERAEPFLYHILKETEARGLPSELVLLPIVESAYQPFAYSNGRAAGIWQFIPSTGKLYGLKQNWWYDGRRDIHASTQAALQYLQNLSKLFEGDWMLALAAYNSGAGTVQRAIKHNKKHGQATDFWHLKLPQETLSYVPKLLALKALIENPGKYGVTLLRIPDTPGYAQINIGSQIDMALAADLAQIDIDTLYRYNPAFNRWATAPDGPHTLLIPTDHVEIFTANLEALPDNQRIKWERHKILNGETLSEIATRYHTTVPHLQTVNDLHNNSIRAGNYLIIPVSSKAQSSYALSAVERKKTIQSRVGATGGKTRVDHIVREGESFWTIARQYKVNMGSLAKWNGMATRDPLRKGQKLVVWTTQKASSQSAAYRKPANTVRPISYTVRSGDSLSRIADRYNVSVNDLHRWNSISGKYLQPGQRLKLYVDVTEQAGENS